VSPGGELFAPEQEQVSLVTNDWVREKDIIEQKLQPSKKTAAEQKIPSTQSLTITFVRLPRATMQLYMPW